MQITLEQAVVNAITAEEAAWSFYSKLAARCEDPLARAFLQDMATVEAQHVDGLQAFARRLLKGTLTGVPDEGMELVETAPSWEELDREVEEMDLTTALAIAEEAEQHAASYYDALAAVTSGEVQVFFMAMAQEEANHAGHIEELLDETAA